MKNFLRLTTICLTACVGWGAPEVSKDLINGGGIISCSPVKSGLTLMLESSNTDVFNSMNEGNDNMFPSLSEKDTHRPVGRSYSEADSILSVRLGSSPPKSLCSVKPRSQSESSVSVSNVTGMHSPIKGIKIGFKPETESLKKSF